MASGQPEKVSIGKTLLAFVTLLPTIASAITGYIAVTVNENIEIVRNELKEIELQRTFDLEIYKAVKESLKGTEDDQRIALALVESIGQDPLKSGLLATLEDSSAPEIVAEARSLRTLPRQTETESKISSTWSNWDFDLFHCEGSPDQARILASKLATELEKDGAVGRIRVRPLSVSKNKEAGYQISGYEIRGSADETEMAQALADFANSALNSNNATFSVRQVRQKSPWYISAFLCP